MYACLGVYDYLEPISGIVKYVNHFVCNPAPDKNKDALEGRDIRPRYFLSKNNGKIMIDTIFECMKDHDFYPKSICNHAYDPSSGDMRDLRTVASMVYDFENELFYVCRKIPCEGEYVPFSLRV